MSYDIITAMALTCTGFQLIIHRTTFLDAGAVRVAQASVVDTLMLFNRRYLHDHCIFVAQMSSVRCSCSSLVQPPEIAYFCDSCFELKCDNCSSELLDSVGGVCLRCNKTVDGLLALENNRHVVS